MLGLAAGACHAASAANAAVRHGPSSSNLLAGVHNDDQLLKAVSQHACDVTEQSCLPCSQ